MKNEISALLNLQSRLFPSMTTQNLALRSYGMEVSENILLKFVESYKLPVVSVGSGSATLEHKIQQKNEKIRWICVDPTPSSWCSGEVMIKPQYASVEDLVAAEPELVGKCVLFLNWCFPNKSRYDYDAVILLQPVAFLSTVEFLEVGREFPNGSAGGELFHGLVAKSDAHGYKFCYNATLYYDYDSDSPPLDIRFIWYQKTELPEIEIDLEWDYECKVRHPRDVCVIC